jgi:alpha-mannosidase
VPTGGSVVLSALKQGDERSTLIARVFNPDKSVARAALRIDAPLARAYAVNLLEERESELPVEDGGVAIELRPHEIRTIELEIG